MENINCNPSKVDMALIEQITAFADELAVIRRDIHAHPEIGFEETRTAALVAEKLTSWGIEVHEGIGKTGLVGVIHGKGPGATIGLRADMDALPMEETTDLPYRSTRTGRFHGCGHDGHTAMLLGAARYLAGTRDFAGTVIAIFQPAEEGLGGARAMISDRLFERFACHEIYALHNAPQDERGSVSVIKGPAMAAADLFDIKIIGRGSHAASPHVSVDPAIVAVTMAQAMQTIVSRNINPLKSAVVSITQIHAGTAYNVIPETAHLAGTVRTFDEEIRTFIHERIRELAKGIAQSFGAVAEVNITRIFGVLHNSHAQADAAAQIAGEVVGEDRVRTHAEPKMGSEDFADMLACVPGAYLWLGQDSTHMLHNPGYDFDDAILPIGASLLARIAERRTAALANSVEA